MSSKADIERPVPDTGDLQQGTAWYGARRAPRRPVVPDGPSNGGRRRIHRRQS
ncbi:hypothetical protein ACFQFC_37475 [Amorphoplanes digitatis]|uniref:Uncharacterized protein n=1 Tax=Actinoplanes digitatis TaxID=1868 RepID=A0A7W7HW26_9ACTN|nr:hypothetical protein [Actinoplanes digitatis]MBB4761852.1 hypothetical protein [Actinoplanes digitatis]GID90963.1 hypothetical protein Adi01nite_03750 [Actinoplanes digitatis]